MNTYRTCLAISRAWGLPRSLLFAGLLAAAVFLLSGETVPLPAFEQAVILTNLAPPLTALLLGHALINSTEDLDRLSQRPVVWLRTARYVLIQIAAIPVAVTLSAAVDRALYATVPLFVAAAAVLVVLLGDWYWPPILIGIYGWLRFTQAEAFLTAVDVGPILLAGAVLLGGVAYVFGERLRSQS